MSTAQKNSMIRYILNYLLLNIISPLIPHPKLRAVFFRLIGAEIGRRVRIEKVNFIQVQNSIGNLHCSDDVFIGSGVTLDISALIILDEHVMIASGCSILTHQNFGDFSGNELSKIYKTKYCPVHLNRNVIIGADTTILAGTIIGRYSVIGAKSLVNCNIPENVLAIGIPAKVFKHHGKSLHLAG